MEKRTTAAVVWLTILVGIAATAVVLGNRGGEDLFRLEQARSLGGSNATVLGAARVEAVVTQAPEPVAADRRTPAVRVSCRAEGGGPLRNPWSCAIRYASGTDAHYRVEVQPDGYYSGSGTGIIDGCCVKTPTLD
jgi:Tfp pilus assembly protein FimT